VKLKNVGEIIAERKFKLVRDGFEGETVVVVLGKPQHMHDQSDFYGCPYQIKRPDSEKLMTICGIDAFQALQLAINAIGVELEVIRRDSGGQLIWDGDEKGDLGFPTPDWKKE
jgi:hypothetical protein